MDQTFLSLAAFNTIYLVLCGILLISIIWVGLKVLNTANASGKPGAAIAQHKGKVIALVVYAAAVLFFARIETAARPKTVIDPPNRQLEQRLDLVDSQDLPPVPPADDQPAKWEDVRDANRQENADAREAFKALPEQ